MSIHSLAEQPFISDNTLASHSPEGPQQRSFGLLRVAGGLAVAAASSYLLDQEVGHRLLWGRSKPEITELPGDAGTSHETAVLVTSGFNSRPEATARPLRGAFAKVGRVAMFHDSAAHLNFEDNFQTTLEWTRSTGTKNLILYGPSQGMMLNVAIAPQLKAEGLNLFMLADSSPYSYDDIKGTARRAVLRFLSMSRIARGGPAARFALESIGYTIDNLPQRKSAKEVVAHSLRKMRDPGISSNAQCFDRARFLVTGKLDPYMKELHEVPFVYMGAEDPANDRVVNHRTALPAYQTRHSESILHLTDPDVGHANPTDHPRQYSAMVDRAMRHFGFTPA